MGAQLPKPVTSKVLERFGNQHFSCGVASMNGYRERMEDAHAVVFEDSYSFFGVFDGHVDPHCSAYIGEHLPEAVRKARPPLSDEDLAKIVVDVDQEYLAINKESGSTGTFFIASVESNPEPIYHLQVGNVGDSRVIVGRDGKAVPMTIDHKPGLPEEKARIESCGGFVANGRVDGNLAVSRAFGDGQYKAGTGGPIEQKVIALPDIQHIQCGTQDFVLLCCDGVFEGDFSNEQVVEFVTQKLQHESDLALVAAAVCDMALERNSKDNITCMLVRFVNGEHSTLPHLQYLPGPYACPNHEGFRTAFKAMATMANMSLGQALASRYDYLKEQLRVRGWANGVPSEVSEADVKAVLEFHKQSTDDLSAEERMERYRKLESVGKSITPPDITEILDELSNGFGDGPPEGLDNESRANWFEERAATSAPSGAGDDDEGRNRKIAVDATTFAKLQALQQQTGGQIPLPFLLGLLQNAMGEDEG